MTTHAERQQKIERLAHLPELLERVVAGLMPEQLTTRYIENEWTVAQNVHHVFDSHARGYVNGKLILDWLADYTRCRLEPYWATPDPRALVLAEFNSTFRFTKVSLIPVTGDGQRLR